MMSLYSTVVLLPLIRMHKNKSLPSIQRDDMDVEDEEERSVHLASKLLKLTPCSKRLSPKDLWTSPICLPKSEFLDKLESLSN